MPSTSTLLLVLVAALTLGSLARPARACDEEFETPFDFYDRASAVVVVKAASVVGNSVNLVIVETLRGVPKAKQIAATNGGMCSPSFAKGEQGVAFLDASGALMNEFVRDKLVIAALRKYGSATASVRAGALVDLAVDTDWVRSYEAGESLANRVDLLASLDASMRDRVIARLAKAEQASPLIRVAARLHDPRVVAAQKLRKFDDGKLLGAILADRFESESDPKKLADIIAGTSSLDDRRAALERCERVHAQSLDRFSRYAYETADQFDTAASGRAPWLARASACRTGKRVHP